MHSTFSLISLITFFVLTSPAMAGGREGNGGGVVDCRGQKGYIWSVRLLDLWEGSALKHLAYDDNLSFSNALALARGNLRDHIDHSFYERFDHHLRRLVPEDQWKSDRYQIKWINSGVLNQNVEISPPSDALNSFMARNCKLRGAALFNDAEESLTLDYELYGSMKDFDKAALMVHEAIYKTQREFYDVGDSRSTRRMTACAMSKNSCDSLSASYLTLTSEKKQTCYTSNIRFEYDASVPRLETVFRIASYQGHNLPVPSFVKLTGIILGDGGQPIAFLDTERTLPRYFYASSELGLDFKAKVSITQKSGSDTISLDGETVECK